MHALLRIGERNGKPEFEPVHVESLTTTRFRVQYSPGLAYGLAAEDEIEVAEDGTYTVVLRGGNLVVRVLSSNGVAHLEPEVTQQVEGIGGRLDGQVRNGLTYTIPRSAGLKTIGLLFATFKQATPGVVWEYGNVYEADGQVMDWLRSEA